VGKFPYDVLDNLRLIARGSNNHKIFKESKKEGSICPLGGRECPGNQGNVVRRHCNDVNVVEPASTQNRSTELTLYDLEPDAQSRASGVLPRKPFFDVVTR
jgi:hypothetical protein